MPSPSSALATLRPDLAASFTQFDLAMDRQGFIATKVLPVIDVDTASGTFGKIPVEQLLMARDTYRAPGSGYARSKFTFKTDTFTTQEYGAEEPVDDLEAKMYRRYFEVEQFAAQRAYDAVLRAMESRAASLYANNCGTQTAAVAVSWKTYASSTPIVDIEAAVQAIYVSTGIWPNTLILTKRQFRNLRESANIIDRIKYSGLIDPTAKGITTGVLAQVFDLPNIYVASSTANSAHEGQTASLGSLWSDDAAYVGYIASDTDIRRPTFGRIFHYGEDGSTIGGTVESYRNEIIRGDVIRVRQQMGEKVLYGGNGGLMYKLTGCTT